MRFSAAHRPQAHKTSPIAPYAGLLILFAAALFGGLLGAPQQAQAQTIITTVNGAPITDLDVAQRMRLLRVMHKPASRAAAMQSMIDDQLMLQNTALYGIKVNDRQIGQEIMREAAQMKIAPQVLVSELQQAGVSRSHYKQHFAAVAGFEGLVQALHKGVEVSETQIRQALAKEGAKAAGTEYKVRPIIFVLPTPLTLRAIRGRMAAAEQLRMRFQNCASGVRLARAMDNVAVKDTIVRNSLQINSTLKKLLDRTPVGHLTPPRRTSDGVEMIAVCSKGVSTDKTAARAQIAARLYSAEIEREAARRLKTLRAQAIIVRK